MSLLFLASSSSFWTSWSHVCLFTPSFWKHPQAFLLYLLSRPFRLSSSNSCLGSYAGFLFLHVGLFLRCLPIFFLTEITCMCIIWTLFLYPSIPLIEINFLLYRVFSQEFCLFSELKKSAFPESWLCVWLPIEMQFFR